MYICTHMCMYVYTYVYVYIHIYKYKFNYSSMLIVIHCSMSRGRHVCYIAKYVQKLADMCLGPGALTDLAASSVLAMDLMT